MLPPSCTDCLEIPGSLKCCILRGLGGERIVDVVAGGTELEP